MNEKRIGKLLASGLHMVDVSIDACTPETYAKIRVNGTLEVTRANVLALLRRRRELGAKTRVVVSFVEQPQNPTKRKSSSATGRNRARITSSSAGSLRGRRRGADRARHAQGAGAREAPPLPLSVGAHLAQPARRARVLPAGLGARLGARRLPHHHDPGSLARRDSTASCAKPT
jgi:hypothetical protein